MAIAYRPSSCNCMSDPNGWLACLEFMPYGQNLLSFKIIQSVIISARYCTSKKKNTGVRH